MNPNNSNTSKGCLSWVKGLGAGLLGLLTAAASCAAIMQYIQSSGGTADPKSNDVQVVVVTSEPASYDSTASNASSPQSNGASISAQDRQAVETFLQSAVSAEIAAFQYGDSSYANMFAGAALQALQTQILELNARGVYLDARFDYTNSYIRDIRLPQSNQIEVDWCEYWAGDFYERQTGTLIESSPWRLIAETILIESLNDSIYITQMASGQTFC